MKILLSAYACEPDKGSEPAVGWNWMLALVEGGHEVFVITRSNNASSIQAEIEKSSIPVTPIYYDLPSWCRRWKRWPDGLYFYYLLWQLGAYYRARTIHQAEHFEVVQHITFVTFRQPSFMGRLGIPFILGPVGGGETSPRQLRQGFNWSGRLTELVRDMLIRMARIDPLMNQTFAKASLIGCTTSETLKRIPARYQSKCIVLPAIGVDVPEELTAPLTAPTSMSFLFIGRLLYWKGLHFALRAMPEVQRSCPGARLKIIGKGNDEAWLKQVAREYGVEEYIDWVPSIPHASISKEYRDHVAFVFPSLHDSGGMVILESLAAGLPVICLDLGGPAVFVDSSCGLVLDTTGKDEDAVQKSLAAAMISLIKQPELRRSLAANCASRARQFSWHASAQKLYSYLKI
jgi:glycosyltransferase involved in cell wall biosynthesis